MKTILSIQSHVAFGHVGNAAAVFPLQRLGCEVIPVHTVQFSNHTGYGSWTGSVFEAVHIRDILDGLEARGVLSQVDALLTGYMGSPEIADIIMSLPDRLPKSAFWVCDPVMGDVGRGFFVNKDLPPLFKERAVTKARILTPNLFELEYLAGSALSTLNEVKDACRLLHDRGAEIVVVTSLVHQDTAEGMIEMIASELRGSTHRIATQKLDMPIAPNGAGDVTAALFTGHILQGQPVMEALRLTASGVFAIFEDTLKAGSRELALIQAQDKLMQPHKSVRVLS